MSADAMCCRTAADLAMDQVTELNIYTAATVPMYKATQRRADNRSHEMVDDAMIDESAFDAYRPVAETLGIEAP